MVATRAFNVFSVVQQFSLCRQVLDPNRFHVRFNNFNQGPTSLCNWVRTILNWDSAISITSLNPSTVSELGHVGGEGDLQMAKGKCCLLSLSPFASRCLRFPPPPGPHATRKHAQPQPQTQTTSATSDVQGKTTTTATRTITTTITTTNETTTTMTTTATTTTTAPRTIYQRRPRQTT